MPERHTKHLMFRHDGTCRSPDCKKGGDIKAGTFGWWAVGNIVWHEGCPDPKDLLSVPVTDEEQDARLGAWFDRKAAEDHERFMAARAEREKAGPTTGPHIGGGDADLARPSEPTGHAQLSVTSDDKYADAF